jgi:hypothetical protein
MENRRQDILAWGLLIFAWASTAVIAALIYFSPITHLVGSLVE